MFDNETIGAICTKLASANKDVDVNVLRQQLKEDAQWLIDCADSNAMYGYYPAYMLKCNATARNYADLFGEIGRRFVILVGCIGYYRCAEDRSMMHEYINKVKEWAVC